VPVLVARDSTERGEGVDAGTLTLVGTDADRIVAVTTEVLRDPSAWAVDPTQNPYGDGHAADRIAAAFEHLVGLAPAPARFGSGFSRERVLEAAGYPVSLLAEPVEPRDAQPDRSEELDRWVGR
jgi:UDP-N-acetylglucosamine 2-epimerase (non-hydrolysing)